jgi:hypothetical protein
MQSQRTLEQLARGRSIVERQTVDGGVEQRMALTFHAVHRPEFGPAPTARVGAIECGAAERTAIHRSGLEIE